jgi:hypothetical protein
MPQDTATRRQIVRCRSGKAARAGSDDSREEGAQQHLAFDPMLKMLALKVTAIARPVRRSGDATWRVLRSPSGSKRAFDTIRAYVDAGFSPMM